MKVGEVGGNQSTRFYSYFPLLFLPTFVLLLFPIIFHWIFLSFPGVKMKRRERFMSHQLLGLIRQKQVYCESKKSVSCVNHLACLFEVENPLVKIFFYIGTLLCFGFELHLSNVPRWRLSIIPQKFRWEQQKRRHS